MSTDIVVRGHIDVESITKLHFKFAHLLRANSEWGAFDYNRGVLISSTLSWGLRSPRVIFVFLHFCICTILYLYLYIFAFVFVFEFVFPYSFVQFHSNYFVRLAVMGEWSRTSWERGRSVFIWKLTAQVDKPILKLIQTYFYQNLCIYVYFTTLCT